MKKRLRKKSIKQMMSNIVCELSQSGEWRKKLFAAPVGEVFEIKKEELISHGLVPPKLQGGRLNLAVKVVAINDAPSDLRETGFIAFKFFSTEFSEICGISVNNPKVI